MTPATLTIPTYPAPKLEPVPVKPQIAVERSLARPDAFAKPGTIGQQKSTGKVRIRTIALKPRSGRQRTKKRDPRNVHFF